MNKKYFFKALSVVLLTAIIGFPSVLAGPPGDGNDNDGTGEALSANNVNILEGKKRSRKEIYGKGAEAAAIKQELDGFDAFNSMAYKKVIYHFGKDIRLNELLGITNVIITLLNSRRIGIPPLSRNEKRSLPLLIKYIDRNSELIFPYLPYISLCDDNFQKIPLDHNGATILYGNLNPAPKTRINPPLQAGIAPSANNAASTMQQYPQAMFSLQPGFGNATRPNNTAMPQIDYAPIMQPPFQEMHRDTHPQPVAAHSPIVKKFQYSPNRKIIKCNR